MMKILDSISKLFSPPDVNDDFLTYDDFRIYDAEGELVYWNGEGAEQQRLRILSLIDRRDERGI